MANTLSVVVLTPNGRRNTVKCNLNTTILQADFIFSNFKKVHILTSVIDVGDRPRRRKISLRKRKWNQTVKYYILQKILEQTCAKYEFQANEYDLTHHNHVLDVSTTMRFSGLPNNAFLEMVETKKVRKESEVILGLQLENGERLMGNFVPGTNLWNILTKLAPEQCAPELHPVVIFMRREVYGQNLLKETTLKSLGLTGGRAMLRLIHRTPEQLKVQANVSAPLQSKSKEKKDTFSNTSSDVSLPNTNDQCDNTINIKNDAAYPTSEISYVQSPSEEKVLNTLTTPVSELLGTKNTMNDDEVMDTADSGASLTQDKNVKNETEIMEVAVEEKPDFSHLEEEIIVLGERNALVFSQNMASRLPFDDLPDDFYDLSVNEVRNLFSELGKKREELENIPLQTEALKNLEKNRRVITQLHDHRKVVLRILFPDRIVLQGTFGPLDTLNTVSNFVKDYLQNPSEQFDLYVTPPKHILNLEASLVDSNLVPSALVYFGAHSEDSECREMSKKQYLRDEILTQLTSPEAARFSASKTRGLSEVVVTGPSGSFSQASSSSGREPSSFKKPLRAQPFSVPGPSRAKDSKVPKWFKSGA